ncbi:glycosyltransferase family 4 protein [Emticicia agri]|uniref:Glycosyltransferase n=1 Tax=Emticicia agri TaxID=2492393 RepID=A0A4Q5LVX6_9BACT|nr:glycosyltransferase [Emticicia agri]RYU93719.1 glycosyltransferase [Emticicia agri]
MKIAILGPTHKSFIGSFLPNYNQDQLPDGYFGAPFMGTIISELLNRNYEVIAITTTVELGGNYTIKEFSYKNFKWIVVPSRKHSFRFNGSKLGKIVDFYSFERKMLKKTIFETNPDFLHAFWSYEFASAVVNFPKPQLVTIEDNAIVVLLFFKNFYRFCRLLMSEWTLRKVKFASTVSPYMISYAKKRCENVKVIPNPTKIEFSQEQIKLSIEKRLSSIATPRFIMIFNGWDKRKNGYEALKAFKLFKQNSHKATLHLYGYGTEMNGLAYKDAKTLSLSDVYFNGPVSHDILIDAIQSSHLLIHPALEESFGVVLIEAMSYGVIPIGGAKSGGVPWVINDDSLLVDVSDYREIKLKIDELLVEDYYKKTAFNVYKNTISRFSSKSVIDQYEEYYKEILEKWN